MFRFGIRGISVIAQEHGDHMGPIAGVRLCECALDVVLNGTLLDKEGFCDLFHRVAPHQQPNHFRFSIGNSMGRERVGQGAPRSNWVKDESGDNGAMSGGRDNMQDNFVP